MFVQFLLFTRFWDRRWSMKWLGESFLGKCFLVHRYRLSSIIFKLIVEEPFKQKSVFRAKSKQHRIIESESQPGYCVVLLFFVVAGHLIFWHGVFSSHDIEKYDPQFLWFHFLQKVRVKISFLRLVDVPPPGTRNTPWSTQILWIFGITFLCFEHQRPVKKLVKIQWPHLDFHGITPSKCNTSRWGDENSPWLLITTYPSVMGAHPPSTSYKWDEITRLIGYFVWPKVSQKDLFLVGKPMAVPRL